MWESGRGVTRVPFTGQRRVVSTTVPTWRSFFASDALRLAKGEAVGDGIDLGIHGVFSGVGP